MMIGYFAATAGAVAAGIYDAFTGEIPEWITIPMIALGIIYAWWQGFLVTAAIVALLTFIIGYAFYYTGLLGGGDGLLLTGIATWVPFVKIGLVSLPTPLIVLPLSLVLSPLFYGPFLALRLADKRAKLWALAAIPEVILPPGLSALYASGLTAYIGDKYREELFVEEKPVDALVPEDIVAEPVDVLPPGKKVLEKRDIELLRNAGVKSVKTLEHLPRLGPFLAAALILTLLATTGAVDIKAYGASLFLYNLK